MRFILFVKVLSQIENSAPMIGTFFNLCRACPSSMPLDKVTDMEEKSNICICTIPIHPHSRPVCVLNSRASSCTLSIFQRNLMIEFSQCTFPSAPSFFFCNMIKIDEDNSIQFMKNFNFPWLRHVLFS